jgi:hypothetical protein
VPEALPDPQRQAQVRPLPVLAEARPVDRPQATVSVPQAAAAAAGGFLLGLGSFVIVRVLRRPQATLRLGGGRRRRGKRMDVAASRSFLVDVHLLKER